jgi:hypothetical protein
VALTDSMVVQVGGAFVVFLVLFFVFVIGPPEQ